MKIKCRVCKEELDSSNFTHFSNGQYATVCFDCKEDRKKFKPFKDGKFNTNQPKNFNWLLGYSMPN